MVSAVDDGVGALLDKLEALDIDKNTIVFFLSDNGGPEKDNGSDNRELREGKGSLFEGGIRVPFAVQWPEKIPKGKIYDEPIISLDIFATASELAGVSPRNKLDGVNLIPFLTGKNKIVPHEQLFWRKYDDKSIAIRSGNMKLVQHKTPKKTLYNLADDVSETVKLKDSVLFNQLSTAYDNWDVKNIDPIFLGLIHGQQYDSLNIDRWKYIEKY